MSGEVIVLRLPRPNEAERIVRFVLCIAWLERITQL